MKNNKNKTITVFGNPVEPEDSLVVEMVPELSKHFADIEFVVADPTENLEPPSDPWVILDVGIGLPEVAVIQDLSQLDHVKGQSVHDYDVYMELRLKEKLGQLPRIKVIIVPNTMKKTEALKKVVEVIKTVY